MHRSATNDFHGWMDDAYRTDALIQGQEVRHAWSPHYNHHLSPEVAVTMPLWLDHFLQGAPALPDTPHSELTSADGIAQLRVTPKSLLPVSRCDIYYSLDPDPRARYWRSTEVSRAGDAFTAKLPVHTLDRPLFAFANVYYTLPKPEVMRHLPGFDRPVNEICLSTAFHRMECNKLRITNQPSTLIDDFAHGWHDWYQLNAGNRDHWQNWTRKVTDPKWQGPAGAKLAITFKVEKTNRIAIVVIENEWRNYRGRKKTFVCETELIGSAENQTLTLTTADFKNTDDGAVLTNWTQLDQLGLCAYFSPKGQPKDVLKWNGAPPEFFHIEWR